MELCQKLQTIWEIVKPNEPFPQNTTADMFYEMLFRNVEQYKTVWDLPVFEKFIKEDSEFNKFIITPIEIAEGILTCLKCKSKKILTFSKQTRSGDEPTSVFAKCSNCSHQWVQ